MDDRLKQLLIAAPSLVAGLRGNGTATQAFMEGYQRTLAQMQQQNMLTDQQAMQSADRQRQWDRQATQDQYVAEDRARAEEERRQRAAQNRLGVIPQLAEIGGMAETPDAAQASIESIMPMILDAFGPEAMGVGMPAVEMAQRQITGRQQRQVAEFVDAAMKLDVIADNPDNDPEFTQLPQHIQRIVGKPTARLSELQTLAQQPVGRPARGGDRNPNREALALRAAQGDKEAARALSLLREPTAGGGAPAQEWVIRDGVPTPIAKGTARPGDRPYGGGGRPSRPVTTGDTNRLSELTTSLDDIKVLRSTLFPDADLDSDVETAVPTGTLAKAQASLPNWATEMLGGWGSDAKSRQATIDRVKQVIGKALEGGVLRKEDEYKYEKILPIISDVPQVVKTKLDGLEQAIRLRYQRQLEAMEDAGYDTSGFRKRGTVTGASSSSGDRRPVNPFRPGGQ